MRKVEESGERKVVGSFMSAEFEFGGRLQVTHNTPLLASSSMHPQTHALHFTHHTHLLIQLIIQNSLISLHQSHHQIIHFC